MVRLIKVMVLLCVVGMAVADSMVSLPRKAAMDLVESVKAKHHKHNSRSRNVVERGTEPCQGCNIYGTFDGVSALEYSDETFSATLTLRTSFQFDRNEDYNGSGTLSFVVATEEPQLPIAAECSFEMEGVYDYEDCILDGSLILPSPDCEISPPDTEYCPQEFCEILRILIDEASTEFSNNCLNMEVCALNVPAEVADDACVTWIKTEDSAPGLAIPTFLALFTSALLFLTN
mmetsp:Transcript_26313/g.73550  ORF Transcript_26313/g.73550 Transcript_26313/m.73550 type:complete len:232 (-) Transcript_26313:54-749(-)|eukprot:CAMPEP_0119120652 /NCGR_PEP_ID=MMETSP1310-20130426/1601_1 /TAXON_ID=464262 /ORGANISM="Genus nov. species nov., Strain RCC2339" /LENGTH=231 /DNA_ID=CAMNT_0007110141 /DNA_START=55 /DNA_END=750 /DNA_ORIENTATION=-